MRKLLLTTAALLALTAASPALAQDAPKQGGEIIITYQNDVATLDPAIGYDWQNWSMIKSLFDGLMDYEPGTTTLKPDLAESYEISDDGMVFTFKLRPGVKFHNGREMTADDVKYSIERVLNPETQSPGAGFFGSIKTITAVDPLTVKFELSRPDATFLHQMALNFSHVVPKEAVEEHGADFGKNPVGTGAFKMTEWTLGQRVVFERNLDHWNKGLPHLDKITFEIGQEPTVALLRLQRGEVDVLGDGIPPAQFLQVRDDPQYKDWIVEGGQLHTGYVTMNVKTPPFDNVKVRQAVNHAINKDRIVRVINGRAVPANQPLPPSMPGYDKGYAGYAYDPEKAKALLARVGRDAADHDRTLRHEHRPHPAHRPGNPAGSGRGRHQRGDQVAGARPTSLRQAAKRFGADDLVRRHGLDRRLPDPSNFYGPDPGCGGRRAGRLELVLVLQRGTRKAGHRSRRHGPIPPRRGSAKCWWGSIFTRIREDAPWAPVFNEQRVTMHSPRMGGDPSLTSTRSISR
jgi:peptide/nickel transport system substrate-binding protein/oligopeptide transport system substrate-binding protein